jgi:Cu/Zn superoxide dismutase
VRSTQISQRYMSGTFSALACLGLLWLLTACVTGPTSSTSASLKDSSINATFSSAVLKHTPAGSATLSWTPQDQALTVKISLQGLVPQTSHPAHIHKGSCQHAGAALYTLPTLKADAHGNASTTVVIKGVAQGIPASGWYINVHNGPALNTIVQTLSISCGDIANHNTSLKSRQEVTVALSEDPSPDQAVRGQAQLRLSGQTLTIHVSVSGLLPNSTHDFHIHAGSCSSMGSMLYVIEKLKANARGEADATATLSNINAIPHSGWSLILYQTTETVTGANSDVIACGDVVPSAA